MLWMTLAAMNHSMEEAQPQRKLPSMRQISELVMISRGSTLNKVNYTIRILYLLSICKTNTCAPVPYG